MQRIATCLLAILIALTTATAAEKPFTVVIDAGHGGKDHGALGQAVHEKDVNLGVALKLGKLIEDGMPDAKVVYTRSSDKFVSLQGRADIANRSSGDLFISIHANSVSEKSKTRQTVSGTSVYVLGNKSEENLAVAKRENAVIMLEDDYTTRYSGFDPNSTESYIAFELIQNQHMEHSLRAAKEIQSELVTTAGRQNNGVRQAMFWVLVKTGMPAVLVELDFICNPRQEQYMGSEAGQNQLAEAIFNGLRVYKTSCDRENHKETANVKNTRSKSVAEKRDKAEPAKPKAPVAVATEATDSTPAPIPSPAVTTWRIQFMTSPKQLPAESASFRGLDNVDCYRDGKVWKYTTGNWPTVREANRELAKVRKLFGDAFVIEWCDGKRVK